MQTNKLGGSIEIDVTEDTVIAFELPSESLFERILTE